MNRLDALLRFHEDDPDDAFVRFAVATEYAKAGDPERALAWFEALRRDQPEYVGTYYHLGQLYERMGRARDAMDTWEAGIAEAGRLGDLHAKSELQSVLMEARESDHSQP